MFREQNQKTLEILKKHEEKVALIINDKISSINKRLDKLTLDINNNLTIKNEVRSKTNDLMLSLETSQNILETEKNVETRAYKTEKQLKRKRCFLKKKIENFGR